MFIEILAEQFLDYQRHFKGLSSWTIRRYKIIIKVFHAHSHIELIEDVTEDSVRAFFFNGRVERKWKPATFIGYHVGLMVFFNWCIRQGHITSNPAQNIEKPKLEKHLPPKLTKQEALRLLEVVYNYPYQFPFLRYRNHAIFAIMLYAGLRRGEVLKLRYADVDIENLTIFIYQGKGSKDRVIPMSFTLAQILRRYAAERTRLRKTCPEFFASFTHNGGLSFDGIKHLFVLMKKATRIRFTFHQLRHTFATLMLEGGCDIYSLSKMMGHSDIKTTTIYLAASAEHLRSQMTKHPLN